ncbi:MAG: PQQ-like beta-propeller repeat protein, partial [Candidatus Thermoplasmatota archaeon]|nr:PQQ-like beta-propeller repeat protein [Candidatus Thermoplasmatota archaeon]
MNLTIGVTILFIILSITPMVIGYNAHIHKTIDGELAKNSSNDPIFHHFDKYLYPEGYYSKNGATTAHTGDVKPIISSSSKETTKSSVIETEELKLPQIGICGGLMDSPWPMYGHDARHTGRSPYSTIDTWDLIWRVPTHHWACCSPAIDNDGIIYIGTYPLYAVYPNGTLKWECDLDGLVESSSPAIDENGVIYIGTAHVGNYLHAINPNGTLKWKYPAGAVYTSPAIASDGTIIFSDTNNWNIIALYPNGTQKWEHHTNHVIYSSPAIGQDGTVYCGSHDNYVYALYPNNG